MPFTLDPVERQRVSLRARVLWGAVVFVLTLALLTALTPERVPTVKVVYGQRVTLSVNPDRGTPPFTYQWFRDAKAIQGATASSYVVACFAKADAGRYTVTTSNSAGSLTKAVVDLEPIRP